MPKAIAASTDFARGLTEKFTNKPAQPGSSYIIRDTYGVMPGTRYDKIVIFDDKGNARSVHAFVERETGYVYKAEGWAKPAKGVRFLTVVDALKASDRYGSYLYR